MEMRSIMAKKFGEGVSNAQIALARQFEKAGLTSYSQAVKAFQRGDSERIEAWKKQLAERGK
jgi:hypothetical protein